MAIETLPIAKIKELRAAAAVKARKIVINRLKEIEPEDFPKFWFSIDGTDMQKKPGILVGRSQGRLLILGPSGFYRTWSDYVRIYHIPRYREDPEEVEDEVYLECGVGSLITLEMVLKDPRWVPSPDYPK